MTRILQRNYDGRGARNHTRMRDIRDSIFVALRTASLAGRSAGLLK